MILKLMHKLFFISLPILTNCVKQRWDEPSQHSLIGAKAEDIYYFDNIGNLMGHYG